MARIFLQKRKILYGDFMMDNKKFYSTAVNKAVQKYNVKAYDRLTIRVRKGELEKIKAFAKSKGLSVNAYVNVLIKKDMKDTL